MDERLLCITVTLEDVSLHRSTVLGVPPSTAFQHSTVVCFCLKILSKHSRSETDEWMDVRYLLLP